MSQLGKQNTDVDPLGRANRRTVRISDEETTRRMLDMGVEMVNETGLQLSSDLLRLEDVIQQAGVSRSAVYRRWPTKAHYFADLLRELAGSTHPATAAYDRGTVELAIDVAEENLASLRTPGGRKLALIEMCRLGALQNFQKISTSHEWQTYIALQGTLLGLPEDLALQTDMSEALRKSEDGFIEKMTTFYQQMTSVIGYRLRGFPNLDFVTVATLGSAIVEGLSLNGLTRPEVGSQRIEGDLFNTGVTAEWSLPALGFTSIIMTIVEPEEPQDDWDDARLELVRGYLHEIRRQIKSQ